MDLLQVAQCFDTVNGMPQFSYTKVIHKIGEGLYCSRTPQRVRLDSQQIDPQKFTDTQQIPIEGYYPRFTTDMTRAPSPLPPNTYVKRPNMMAWEFGQGGHPVVLQEIEVCELLRKHPHQNIATYYGCEVSDGRVVGLCFKAYRQTLMERVNPNHRNKQQSAHGRVATAICYLSAIREAIKHIHSLRHVHNDINPHNIMFDDDDNPMIIDFDSCLPLNASLAHSKRTPGWYDSKIQTSDVENDWNAVAEMEAWLKGSPEELRFHES